MKLGNRGFPWRATAWLALLACMVALPAAAQSAATSATQQAARAFLVFTDRDDGKGSWDTAGKQFQDAIAQDRWSAALHGIRSPLGTVASRTLEATDFTDAFPGATRNGHYAILTFRTRFAAREASETVTLEREADGRWSVIGYVIR
jgi:hypothetical protein